MGLRIGYAYPNSTYASQCGASDKGCYIVIRDHNVKTGEPLRWDVLAINSPFATSADAQRWIDGWTE